MVRINVGCGRTPVKGWKNFDNTKSLFLAKHPVWLRILMMLKFVSKDSVEFVGFIKVNEINYADVSRRIPEPDNSVEVLYSSHMLEHLDVNKAKFFLQESRRVLSHGGIIRISVPDLKSSVERYLNSGDAEEFMKGILLHSDEDGGLKSRIKYLLMGNRGHQWMYDGKSLCGLLILAGFNDVKVVPAGSTTIPDPGNLDLFERASESVFVEAVNP